VRYTAAEDIDTGFATFAMEGGQVPVFKSNAIPRAGDYPEDDTNDGIFAVNMASVELAQLQEVMVQDLAKLGPQERMAVDQYNVLVSESGDGDTVTPSTSPSANTTCRPNADTDSPPLLLTLRP